MTTSYAADMYRTAQVFLKAGQPVFPCKSRGVNAKKPLTVNGFLDATLDRDVVKRWVQRYPNLALGIPTGILFDVLDVDVKHGADGRVHLPYLTRMGLLNGCLKVVNTPSGGFHLYFPASKGLTNKASSSLGLDVRALGGYVLAAPSYIETDDYHGGYVEAGETENSTGEPLLWNLILSALMPMDTVSKKPIPVLPSERRASVASLREWLSIRQAGERNNALHWAVCRCIENGVDPHEMVEVALLIGLAEDEVLLTVNSALKRAGILAEELDSEVEALFPEDLPADLSPAV